jgi:hypothetical protein
MAFTCVSGGLYAEVSSRARLQSALFLSVWLLGSVNATLLEVADGATALHCVAGATSKVGTNVSIGAEAGSVAVAKFVRGMCRLSRIAWIA